MKLKLNGYLTSPFRIMLILFLIICFVETVLMLLVGELHGLVHPAAEIIIDVVLLGLFIFPAVYKLVVSPLIELIAARRVVEDALRISTERYRQLIDAVEGIVWEADPSTFSFTFVSQKAEEILGYPVQCWIEVPTFWVEHLHPEDRAWVVDFSVSATRNLQNHVFEYRMLAASGGTVWLRHFVTVVIEAGKAVSMKGLMVDITEKKNSELELAASENRNKLLVEKLQLTINSLNEAVIIVDAESNEIAEVNLEAEKMFGYTRDELIGAHPVILHLNELMYRRFDKKISEAYCDAGYLKTAFRMKRRDGSVFESEHSVVPINRDDGSCSKHVCVVRDISQRVLIEEELATLLQEIESRNVFVESVLANLKSGIIVVDLDFRITMVNSYVAEICGIAPDRFIGKRLVDICPELRERMVIKNTDDELAVNFCGAAKVIGFSSFDLFAADTTVIGQIINFRDLSEIITIRREMRKKERLSAMGEVVARVAHEMRNPLFGMTAAAQILEMELALDVSQKQLMTSLLKESRRLNNLVEELLDTTRELRIKKESVNLRKIIDESISITRVMLEQNCIAVVKSIPDKDIFLSVDADKIEQVMINLIKNAMEACKTGGIVNVVVELCDESAVVKVVDNGTGIPEDILDTIFDVFYTTKRAGTGMGLSISKNIVEAHGGSLAACNNPEGGATFVMTIPWAGGAA